MQPHLKKYSGLAARRSYSHQLCTCRMSASTPVARSSDVSWNMTGVPSLVGRMSICITCEGEHLVWPLIEPAICSVAVYLIIIRSDHALQPAASALCRAASVFSGASLPPALCPTTSGLPGRASSQGAGSTMASYHQSFGRTLACPGHTVTILVFWYCQTPACYLAQHTSQCQLDSHELACHELHANVM